MHFFRQQQIPQVHPSMNVKMKVKINVASVADTTATISMLLSFSSVSVESITAELHYYDQLSLEVLISLLLHSTSLGSGSHSPFPMHVDAFGPESISPREQANVTLVSSTSRAG